MPSANLFIAAVSAFALASFGLSALQALRSISAGTDHPVHVFLIRAIRASGNRLFVRIPRLLNDAFVGANPLYLHWIFAQLPSRAMYWAERLLNPAMNALHVALFSAIAAIAIGEGGITVTTAMVATGCFAFTPQFFHALSARNFGLSSRSIGLFLLTAYFLAAYGGEAAPQWPVPWLAMAIIAYLILAFNTFALQALVILSLLLILLAGRFLPATGAIMGLALFVAIHPRYAVGYLRHTWRFIHAYAAEVAPVYILRSRFSIWRDLVRDIWVEIHADPIKGLRYAYQNAALIVVLLNPLLLVAVATRLGPWPLEGTLLNYSVDVALCGGAAMLLTSLRATRFLGEPERYVEAVTPWATVAGTAALAGIFGLSALIAVAVGFLFLSCLQLLASGILSRHVGQRNESVAEVTAAIAASRPDHVRLCSNNEQYTKLLMHNDWEFSYCIAAGSGYCGMSFGQAFSVFPRLHREACEKIVATYRINVCVLDRSLYETLFDIAPEGLRATKTLYESPKLRVLALKWEASPTPPPLTALTTTASEQ